MRLLLPALAATLLQAAPPLGAEEAPAALAPAPYPASGPSPSGYAPSALGTRHYFASRDSG